MRKDDFLINLFVGTVLMVASIQDLFSRKFSRKGKR